MNIIINQDIPLSFCVDLNETYMSCSMYILEAEDSIRPNVLSRSKTIQWISVGMAWLFVIIGTYFRSIFYGYLLDQYRCKEFTPINCLSLVVSIVQHLGIITVTFTTTSIVFTDDSLATFDGGTFFCTGLRYLTQYYLMYSFIGGLGISIYRILIIKESLWVRDRVGEEAMKNIILFGGLFVGLFFVLILNYHDYEDVTRSTCMMMPKALVLQVLDEYGESREHFGLLSYFLKVRILVRAAQLIMTSSEISIYVIFFHHMYKNDNKDSLRRLLGSQVINQRNQRNAITFFGQFCSFVFEMTQLLIFIAGLLMGTPHWKRGNLAMGIALISWQIFFALMSFIEVMTSNVLRNRFLSKINFANIMYGMLI